MLKPLQEWICDVCDKVIEKPEDGFITASINKQEEYYGFKICHKEKCADNNRLPFSELQKLLGENGINNFLSLISAGLFKNELGEKSRILVENFDEFVDLFRRLQIPYYEEARTKFNNQKVIEYFSDSNEVGFYFSKELKRIITNF